MLFATDGDSLKIYASVKRADNASPNSLTRKPFNWRRNLAENWRALEISRKCTHVVLHNLCLSAKLWHSGAPAHTMSYIKPKNSARRRIRRPRIEIVHRIVSFSICPMRKWILLDEIMVKCTYLVFSNRNTFTAQCYRVTKRWKQFNIWLKMTVLARCVWLVSNIDFSKRLETFRSSSVIASEGCQRFIAKHTKNKSRPKWEYWAILRFLFRSTTSEVSSIFSLEPTGHAKWENFDFETSDKNEPTEHRIC